MALAGDFVSPRSAASALAVPNGTTPSATFVPTRLCNTSCTVPSPPHTITESHPRLTASRARFAPLPGPWDDCFGMPDGVDVTLTWPGVLELMITSPLRWVVVYDLPPDTVCVEPQSGPPNGLNTDPAVVAPGAPLAAEMSWSWRGLA